MTSKFALQKVLIRLTVPKEEADKSYKTITKRKPRKTKDYAEFRHYRFLPPTKFIPRSFRTKIVNDDIRLVFGMLKPDHHKLEGSGLLDYFTKAYDYVSNKASDAFDYIKKAVSITDYSTTTKALLDQYGNLPVMQIQLRREPLDITLELALQGVSGGKWLELKKKNGFDAFYHLSMLVTIGGAVQRVLKSGRIRMYPKKLAIEKLAVVSINEKVDITPDMETIDVPITSRFTIRGMFDKAREQYGDTRFFSYSALGNNNCQNFIQMLLDVEGLYTEPIKNFVFQDLTQLVKELPDSTAFISQGITHLGALANKYLGIGGKIPRQYVENLTEKQKAEQTALINKSKEEYKEGKVEDRPDVSSTPNKRSPHVIKFEKKYGFPITDKKMLKKTFPDTDIETILSKGAGAYGSSGSRPNVSVAQWSYARLASVLTAGKALRVDKDLVGPISMGKIKGSTGGSMRTRKTLNDLYKDVRN